MRILMMTYHIFDARSSAFDLLHLFPYWCRSHGTQMNFVITTTENILIPFAKTSNADIRYRSNQICASNL